ncbi:MAG: flagellar biosynthesis anti-sigma factor FlgM [Lachnospiraceae bacterium]|nr:flagellar biosynthesis anti-sigma factor FlgM [Lachnospiraceae bacterium]
MRIDAYAQVQQLYSTKKAQKITREAKTGHRDQLQISSKGKDIQVAKQALQQASDIREDVAGALKEAIKNGSYEVSAEGFAAKVIEKYQQSQIVQVF